VGKRAISKGQSAMMIKVISKDKSQGCVEASQLDCFINMNIVMAFFRPSSNEWVDVASGNIRKNSDAYYAGPERRFKSKKNASTHTR
jgi:hypothetical protein